MWGWRHDPTPTAESGRREHFPCKTLCRREGTNAFEPSMRAAHHCALPDMDVSTWTGERAYSVYMGAPEDYSRSGESRSMGNDWTMPHEDPYEMGCPGAWYRSPFVLSLLRFYRDRDQQGNRIANPALDHCEDPLVHEAIVYLERHEESAIGEWLYQIHARRNQ